MRQLFLDAGYNQASIRERVLPRDSNESGGPMAGAIVLTLITSFLTTMQMPESVRRMVLGATLLLPISIFGRQRGFRQYNP